MGWRYVGGVRFGVLFKEVHSLCLINFCQTVEQPTHWLECSNFKFWKFPNGVQVQVRVRVHHAIPFKVDLLKAHGVPRLTAINWGGPPGICVQVTCRFSFGLAHF